MQTLQLCLHAGAAAVTRTQLMESATPAATESWHPISHGLLLDTVETQLRQTGLKVTGEVHALSQRDNGARYFGMLQVESLNPQGQEYSWVLGLRNSHDKVFPAALAAGSRVFVCDNLSFSGEVKLARRHIRFIERDLPQVTAQVVSRLAGQWNSLQRRIDAYKSVELSDTVAHDLVVKLLDARAINTTDIPMVLKEWRTPRHPEFAKDKSAWRLFNAGTEAVKGTNVFQLPKRTEALHGVFDAFCGTVFNN